MPQPKSYNDKLADAAAEHALDLLRYDSDTRARMLGFLARLQVTLAERLRAFRIGKTGTEASRLRLRTLYAQVNETIRQAFSDIADAHTESLIDLAAAEAEFAVAQFQPISVAARLSVNLLTRSQLRHLAIGTAIDGAPSREWWSRQAGDLVTRFRHEVEEGIALGETNEQIAQRIRGRATGRRNVYEINGRRATYVEFRGGVMDTSTRHAMALIRTSVQSVSGAAVRDTYAENQDVVQGIVQISTLDTRTTATCVAYGGKAWALPDYRPIGHDLPYVGGIPRHWGCRSREAPVLRSWQELGINLRDVEPPGAVGRWSRLDGEVPADITMDEFLRRRSDAQVDAMLGDGVAALWRSGQVKLEDLIDRQSGRPLSLVELTARFGRAA